MRKLVNELDHLCSIKEFSNNGGTLVLMDEERSFNYQVDMIRVAPKEFLVNLPLVKALEINPLVIISGIHDEIKKKIALNDEDEESFTGVLDFFSKSPKDGYKGDIRHLFLGMPSHSNQEFYDTTEQLMTIRFNEFTMNADIDQIDVAMFGNAPYNIMYTALFATMLSYSSGLILQSPSINFSFRSPYVLKENLQRIAKVLDFENELDPVKIRFKKPIYDYRDIDWESIEIEILWRKKAAIFYELLFIICFNNYNTLNKNRHQRTIRIKPATSLIIFFEETLLIAISQFSSALNADNHQ